MSKEYTAEVPHLCASCGDVVNPGDALFFGKDGKKFCGSCGEGRKESAERFDGDGFGSPE